MRSKTHQNVLHNILEQEVPTFLFQIHKRGRGPSKNYDHTTRWGGGGVNKEYDVINGKYKCE